MKKSTFLLLTMLCLAAWGQTQDLEDFFEDILDEPEYFEEKSFVVQIGYGIRSDVNLAEKAQELDQLDTKMLVPPLSLTLEKNVWENLGVGLTLGGQVWRVPVFQYQYRYFIGSLRATYHFEVMKRLDPYIGGAGTFRYFDITNQQENSFNTKITPAWLVGARYYFTDRTGLYAEAGNDSMSWYKLGLVVYFP